MLKKYNKFTWWLNLTQSSTIGDGDFSIMTNMLYNQANQVQTRRGYIKFGNSVWSTPFSSYFFHKRDDTGAIICLWVAGTVMYKFDGTNWSSIKTGLIAVDWDGNPTRWDFAVYKNIVYMCDGYNNYASWNGTTYTEYPTQPKCKYISYLLDAIYCTGEIANPITIYHTAVQPANANTITTDAVVIWWEEWGKINALYEYGQTVLLFKDNTVYAYLPWQSGTKLDTQSWGYSDRSVSVVENSLVFLSDRWVDTLKFRNWVTWASALESKPLWEKVRELTKLIQPKFYNSNVAYYNKATNNYYFCYDSDWDDRPDKTLVYSSSTQWWSEYLLPPMFDMWEYITDEWIAKHVFTSALWWQMYELEVWFDDDWAKIQAELQTKSFDFWDPWQTYSVSFVDITWFKQEWWEITIKIIWDSWVVQEATITDTNITINRTWSQPLGQRPLWLDPIWWLNTGNDLKLYPFTIKVPMYQYLSTIAVNISWTVQFIFEKITINVDGQPVELFNYNNVL